MQENKMCEDGGLAAQRHGGVKLAARRPGGVKAFKGYVKRKKNT
jgi:hypothetical protein